jgi:hypothetical protein
MPFGVAAGLGAAWLAHDAQKSGAKKAANAAQAGADGATEEQRRQFDLTRQDQMPWLDAGRGALDRMNRMLAGDYSGFMTSPDFLAARDMGLQGLDRGAASRGALFSGGADADRIKFSSDLATQNLGNWWNKLAGMSGTGQATASNLGQLGANAANQVGNNMMLAGNARGSSYINKANADSSMWNQFGQVAGNYLGGRNGQSWGWGGV